ncbi:MAG: hypothetical protein KAU31_10810, partial [Spirochaetaceae bacterium]|nr:hypothetical protein [Spirochaetaceae bacterium]
MPERSPESSRASSDKRAREILATLTLREKVRLMSGTSSVAALAFDFAVLQRYNRRPYPAGGLPRHGVPPVLFSDG